MAGNDRAQGAQAPTPAPNSTFKPIIAAMAVLAIGSVGAGWSFFRGHGAEMRAEAPAQRPAVFMDVPDMLVNLAGAPGERMQYLKVKLVLEVREEKQVEAIRPAMPRVIDIFQTYLRELRPSDLSGSAGLFRLREELTRRVNAAVSPGQVSAVLFKELVVQ
jgi:flagellar protein FliL